MDLERISTEIRPRRQWEALDLGFIMARKYWGQLVSVWLIIGIPLFVLLHLLLYDHPIIAVTIIWWLKPILERPLLYIVSQALFGEIPTIKQTLKAFPKLAYTQWFASLTYRRFSFTRSMDLPVIQLEKLRGKQRSKRLRLLHNTVNSGASWLTIISVHIEMILYFAILALIFLLVPAEIDINWKGFFVTEEAIIYTLQNTLYFICISLVAPFYVTAGFSLYINRRILLEGWDIELAFRRIINRTNISKKLHIAALLCISLCVGWGAPLNESYADEANKAAIIVNNKETSKKAIEQVLNDELFHEVETVRRLKILDDWQMDDEDEDENLNIPDWLISLVQLLANSIEVVLWSLAIILILIFAHKYRYWLLRYLPKRITKVKSLEKRPDVIFGMEVSRESLPDDIIEEVIDHWDNQHYREAMSLLYRATLSRLMDQYNLAFRECHTENECAKLVSDTAPETLSQYFTELTHSWKLLAYAHHIPSNNTLEQLCNNWPKYFNQDSRNE